MKGCCFKGESCQFAHSQDELKVVHVVEDAPIVKRLKDYTVGNSKLGPNAKKKMSRMDNSKQAMPLDLSIEGGSPEPVKAILTEPAYTFASQTISPPHNLDVPAAKLMQRNQQEMMPAIQGFEKPYYLQSVLKERMQCQPMKAPPGLGVDTRRPALLECQRLRQSLTLGDCPPVPEVYNIGALCMGLEKLLKGSAWDSPPVSEYSPSQYEKSAAPGIDDTFGDFGMTRFNLQMH
jgi:hypothetical protein